ncbi:hypothetical protein DFH06DRAFT_561839 [Mycena polygramma]|nr:hypothetical protein DFH06DRAFT_561839 [Mycena polygramma]
MSQSTTIIDDRDLTAVSYTGTWVVGGTVHEHAGTVSSSVNVGDHFSVAFIGSNIAVYGTYDASSAGVVTSYAIDGGAAATVTSASSPLDSFQQLFWQSNTVVNGAHNLVVTMKTTNSGTDGEGTVWFDYFNVTADATIPVPPSPSSSSTSSISSTTSSTSITTSIISSGTSSGTSSKDSSTASSAVSSSSSSGVSTTVVAKKSSHAGVIGGVIGAVAFIALVMAALFFWRKRHATDRYAKAIGPNMSTPFNGLNPTQTFLLPTPATPISDRFPASSAAYSPYNPGGSDARATYAVAGAAAYGHTGQVYPSPQAPPQGAYDPFASVAPAVALQPHPSAAVPQPRSSYAPTESASSAPSSSQYAYPQRGGGGPLSVVGGAPVDTNDSVAELKRRQQQVVNSYEQGVGSASAAPPLIQHVDSGVRALNPAGPAAVELPPTYTPN